MQELDLYKLLLMVAVYRAGGQVTVTPDEFDAMRKEIGALRIGTVDEGKILIRVVPN